MDGAIALDGGSIGLWALDQSGVSVELRLDWSIASRRRGATQLLVNGSPLAKASPEEERWMSLLRDATIQPGAAARTRDESPISKDALVLGDDIAAYFGALEEGTALRHLADRLISLVSSAEYQQSQAVLKRLSVEDRARALLMEGRRIDAIKAYREAHPAMGVAAAASAVQALAVTVEEAAAAQQRHAADGDPRRR